MAKIDFAFETGYGIFRDALHLPDDHGFTQAEIAALQAERLNVWVAAIENPPLSQPEIVEIDGVRYEKIAHEGQILLKPMEV